MNEIDNKYIKIDVPEVFGYVGAKFTISGWVNLEWFGNTESEHSIRMDVEYLGLDSRMFMGGGASNLMLDELDVNEGRVRFSFDCNLSWLIVPHLEKSHGRMTVKISGNNKSIQSVYLPLIVKQFVDDLTFNEAITNIHTEVGNTEARYENDLKTYYAEMQKVYESRKAKDEDRKYEHLHNDAAIIGFDIYEILEKDDENFKDYTYSEEDQREDELNEMYRDALEWRGPLAGGIVSTFNGFELRVHSDDHDSHFHVIHKGKGIDARFSFPEMQLINYKSSKNTISSKSEKLIRELCLQPEVFKKFEEEFSKRPSEY